MDHDPSPSFRLLLEAVDAASGVFGAGRVSVRISPLVPFNDVADSNPEQLVEYVSAELSRRRIGFLELRHADHRAPGEQALATIAKQTFRGPLFVNGGFDLESAGEAIRLGQADAVVFGSKYVANPDLVERLQASAILNPMNPATLYTPGPVGYTDYPAL